MHTCVFLDPLISSLTSCSEPGYYETDNFGIRIENLMVVVPMPSMGEFGGRGKKEKREEKRREGKEKRREVQQ